MTAASPPLLDLIREDYRAHESDWTRPGFRTLAIYRLGVWRMSIRNRLLRAPFSLLYRVGYRFCRNVYGIELPYTARVGRRVVIEHQGGIVIHGSCVIGDECIIRQNCTLGIKCMDDLGAAPVLEDRVNLGAGSVILGAVIIGEDAIIGANAVVLSDVPPGVTAVGVPARIIRKGDAARNDTAPHR